MQITNVTGCDLQRAVSVLDMAMQVGEDAGHATMLHFSLLDEEK